MHNDSYPLELAFLKYRFRYQVPNLGPVHSKTGTYLQRPDTKPLYSWATVKPARSARRDANASVGQYLWRELERKRWELKFNPDLGLVHSYSGQLLAQLYRNERFIEELSSSVRREHGTNSMDVRHIIPAFDYLLVSGFFLKTRLAYAHYDPLWRSNLGHEMRRLAARLNMKLPTNDHHPVPETVLLHGLDMETLFRNLIRRHRYFFSSFTCDSDDGGPLPDVDPPGEDEPIDQDPGGTTGGGTGGTTGGGGGTTGGTTGGGGGTTGGDTGGTTGGGTGGTTGGGGGTTGGDTGGTTGGGTGGIEDDGTGGPSGGSGGSTGGSDGRPSIPLDGRTGEPIKVPPNREPPGRVR